MIQDTVIEREETSLDQSHPIKFNSTKLERADLRISKKSSLNTLTRVTRDSNILYDERKGEYNA